VLSNLADARQPPPPQIEHGITAPQAVEAVKPPRHWRFSNLSTSAHRNRRAIRNSH